MNTLHGRDADNENRPGRNAPAAGLWLAWLARRAAAIDEHSQAERLIARAYVTAGVVFTDDPAAIDGMTATPMVGRGAQGRGRRGGGLPGNPVQLRPVPYAPALAGTDPRA